jgi:rod shape-determining protein MreB
MGIFSPKLGIDLGTANILIFKPGRGIIINEPSVVAMSEMDKEVLAVGLEAKDMIGKTPDNIIAYRPMKDGVIADYKVTEIMLRHFIGKALGGWNFLKPEVLVSVPAGITSAERRAVVEASLRAGAKQAYVVKEPILAAIGANIPINEASGQMIVDIGGGTTDVAVVSLGGIVASNSVKCGGNKLDESIVNYVKSTYNLAIGDKTAEKIKMRVGSAIQIEDEPQLIIKGRDYITGLPKSVSVSSNEIAGALDTDLKTIINAIKDVLQETPPELASDIMTNGITMTGGSALLQNLPELVTQRIGVAATVADEPLFCVARGTGIALRHLDTFKRAVLSKQ